MDRVVFVGSGKGSAVQSGTLIRKQILPRNKVYIWPGRPDKKLVINDSVLDQIVSNFGKYIDTVPFVKVNERNGHTEDPEATRGIVVGLEKTDDGLDAIIQPIDDAAREMILKTRLGASAAVDMAFKRRDDGTPVGAVLRHVAWTPEPWIAGMRSFEEVSLSGETFEAVYMTPGEETDAIKKGGETEMTDINETAVQELVKKAVEESTASLRAELTATKKELDEAGKMIEQLGNTLQSKISEGMEAAVDAELSAMVSAGLPPVIAELARPIMLHGSTEVHLSADKSSTIGEQIRGILRAFPKIDLRELGEGKIEGYVVLSSEQVADLGIKVNDESEADMAAENEDEKAIKGILATIPEKLKN